MLEVRLLGSFDVKYKRKQIQIASRPAQSLFAYLILSAGTAHRREKLAGLLWPDSLEETARDNLRHALWRLRKSLPSSKQPKAEYLITDDLSITFNASAEYWFDATELEKLSETASADELIAVLSTYQGELLPGFYDEWVVLEREHLSSIFEHHMARLMSLLQEEKRWLDVLDWGERWIKLGQKPEPAYRALMSAHAANGEMSKVAATYERCVKSLRELGMEPSEQTKELYESIKSGKESPSANPVSMMHVVKESSSNIPVPLTSFIGREKELKEIAKQLSSSRLVTLTGPGGVGKTRLAIQTAHDSIKKFKDGVFWVGLVGLSDEHLIPQEIAQSLNVGEASDEPIIETLKSSLKSQDILLVIDNCEHLIRACAQYAEQLLAACPKLKILATSIEPLGLFNETIWQVPSLALPGVTQQLSLKKIKEFASVELFHQRAGHAKTNFVLDEKNAKSVMQICQRLDGMPLAIELAAARIKVLSAEEIAARLDDRFSLLTAGSRTTIERHQTLRATIDWSYDLLTQPEQILFGRMSVFAGGFDLEAIETVCGFGVLKREDVLDLLARLVDKSLAIVQGTSSNSGTRYRFLETIREYARQKLESCGEADITRDRHLKFFMQLAEEAELRHFSSEQLIWFNRVETEIENMRAAMDWSMAFIHSTDSEAGAWRQESGLRLMGALVWFWHRNYGREASERSKHMLAITDKPTLGRARTLYSLGFLYWTVNNFSEARRYLEEALTISRKLDDQLTLARSLGYLGAVASAESDYIRARSLLDESLRIARGLGAAGRKAASWALAFLGDVHFMQGDYTSSKKLYEEAVALAKEAHEKNMLGLMIRRLGYIALKQLDNMQATQYFKESLKSNQEVGHSVGLCACLSAFANLALAQGKPFHAAQLYGVVESYLNTLSSPLFYSDEIEYKLGVSNLQKQLGEVAYEKAWSKGSEMTMEQAIEFALKETGS